MLTSITEIGSVLCCLYFYYVLGSSLQVSLDPANKLPAPLLIDTAKNFST